MIPRATYRLQFHKAFTFADAIPLAPYLAGLGVSHLYASPIATARAGSMHGYDVVDPTRINPELGGEAGFRDLVAALRREGLGVILDIVPNHLAVGRADNRWWLDVLENGPRSAHAQLFDIDRRPADPALRDKLLAPFLGAPYAQALAGGDIRLTVEDGLAAMAYATHRFPIRPEDRDEVLTAGLDRYDPAGADGRQRLHALLERQHYRLAWWRTAGDEINWRRFFDIIELAGVRAERPEVFDLIHALPLRLYAEGLIDGLRADHVDGLADPAAYCRTLRERLRGLEPKRPADAPGGPAYVVVEKILGPGEALAACWDIDGTTGYDFMNEVSALQHDPAGEAPLNAAWAEISRRSASFPPEALLARTETLARDFSGPFEAVVAAFHELARADVATRDVTAGALRRALAALLAVFPVYRTYVAAGRAPAESQVLLAKAVAQAKTIATSDQETLDRIAAWLTEPGQDAARADAIRRFQQLSAPIAAKAVEDTAFYRYGRLLSRNDVGFDPAVFASAPGAFHAAAQARLAAFPAAMLATATHDHKRGEDVRARLAVLSEGPGPWIDAARRWRRLNAGLGEPIDPAEEYSLYQTLVGAWPMALTPGDAAGLAAFGERVGRWQEKALREAKLRSSWAAPDEAYEASCARFLAAILDPGRSAECLDDLARFAWTIAPAGALNGLVQTTLRCTAPGMPDLFQGAEFWDLSLVDPDNRRPVDYPARRSALAADLAPGELMTTWRDGRIKQALIARILGLRRTSPALFEAGGYEPLEARGRRADHVFGFVRRNGAESLLVAVALHCADAVIETATPLPPASWWGDTALDLPADLDLGRATNAIGDMRSQGESASLADLFRGLPVAVLTFGA